MFWASSGVDLQEVKLGLTLKEPEVPNSEGNRSRKDFGEIWKGKKWGDCMAIYGEIVFWGDVFWCFKKMNRCQ